MKTDLSASREGYLKEKYRYFHLRDTAGQERDYHYHDFDKIVIMLGGNVDYAVESGVFSLKAWDVLLVRHHTIHKAIIDRSEPYERIIIYLDETYFSSVMEYAGLTQCFSRADDSGRYLIPAGDEGMERIRRILEEYESCDGGGRLGEAMRETLILQLLITIDGLTDAAAGQETKKYDEKISSALTYINANLSRNVTVGELAGHVYVSESHFMRIFKENVGMGVHEYIRRRRLLCASRLIREGMPACDASEKVGFEDYSSFYRAFKATFGITPKEIKRF